MAKKSLEERVKELQHEIEVIKSSRLSPQQSESLTEGLDAFEDVIAALGPPRSGGEADDAGMFGSASGGGKHSSNPLGGGSGSVTCPKCGTVITV